MTLDTPMVVSARAFRMPPSKMAFRPGQEITLDNALKILMVKSANDVAVTIAEGVSGSVEAFASEMNRVAAELGMRESHFVNPNGLHHPAHVSSARDMAIVGRALYRDFPEHADLYGIGALRLGNRIIPTHNGIMGRYPGADGMKTGFVCASGFNVVASATRNGRRLIAVVLGYPNARARTIKAANLFDEGFAMSSSGRQVASLPSIGGGAPDIRSDICGPNRRNVTEDDFAVPVAGYAAPTPASADNESPAAFFANDGRPPAGSSTTRAASITAEQMAVRPSFDPVPVYVGRAPGWNGAVAGAAKPVARALSRRGPMNAIRPSRSIRTPNASNSSAPKRSPRKRRRKRQPAVTSRRTRPSRTPDRSGRRRANGTRSPKLSRTRCPKLSRRRSLQKTRRKHRTDTGGDHDRG